MTRQTDKVVDLDGESFLVAYKLSPIIPATYDDPAEGGEIEITSVARVGSDEELLERMAQEKLDKIESILYETACDDAADLYDDNDYDDYR